jgi:predicted Zn-dependent protease
VIATPEVLIFLRAGFPAQTIKLEMKMHFTLVLILFTAIICAQNDVLAEKSQRAKQATLAGDYATAVKLYRELVAALPANPGLRLNLGLTLEKSGQPAAAIPELERATKAEPNFAPAWFLLGLAYQQLGQPKKAIVPLRKSVGLDDRNVDAHFELADAALAAGESQEAAKEFQIVADRRPELAKAWQGLGLAYVTLGDLKRAEQCFGRVAALPDSPEIHELLAESDQRLGRRVEAVEEWRKAVALAPNDLRLQGRLAESLVRDRKYDEAERILQPLAAAHPDNGDWQYLMGDVLFEQRRADAALPHLMAAERLMSGHLPTFEVLGRVYLALDQPDKAVRYLEKARALDDGSISFALSTAYRRLGREAEAKAALARYRELSLGVKR